MWLTKFLDIISRYFNPDPLSGREALARLNPDKIYIENVRSVLQVSHSSAVRICETAVRQGLFKRGVEVIGPDGSVAISASKEEELPATVRCWTQNQGEHEEVLLATDALQKIIFYRLNDSNPDTLLHA